VITPENHGYCSPKQDRPYRLCDYLKLLFNTSRLEHQVAAVRNLHIPSGEQISVEIEIVVTKTVGIHDGLLSKSLWSRQGTGHGIQGYAHIVGTLVGNTDDRHVGIKILQTFTPWGFHEGRNLIHASFLSFRLVYC